jgi:hypothetical protein
VNFSNEFDLGVNNFFCSFSSMSNLSFANFIKLSRVTSIVSPTQKKNQIVWEHEMRQTSILTHATHGEITSILHCRCIRSLVTYPIDAYCCYPCKLEIQYQTCPCNHYPSSMTLQDTSKPHRSKP